MSGTIWKMPDLRRQMAPSYQAVAASAPSGNTESVTADSLLRSLWENMESIESTNQNKIFDREREDRFQAAMDAIVSGRFNQVPENIRKEYIEKYSNIIGKGRDIEHARASYPGFASGGEVTGDRLSGPNPPGPDHGYAPLQVGEFVVNAQQAQKPENAAILREMNADDRGFGHSDWLKKLSLAVEILKSIGLKI